MRPVAGVLIASSAEKAAERLGAALAPFGLPAPGLAGDGAAARRALAESACGLLLVNAPLRDEFGHELALHAAAQTSAGIVLLVRAELYESAAARVEDAGVFVVAKPVDRALLAHAVRLALASHGRFEALQKQNALLRRKIEDIRLIDRAKCALIQYRQMTEPEAHRCIEQLAMDTQRQSRAVAQEILLRYEGTL